MRVRDQCVLPCTCRVIVGGLELCPCLWFHFLSCVTLNANLLKALLCMDINKRGLSPRRLFMPFMVFVPSDLMCDVSPLPPRCIVGTEE